MTQPNQAQIFSATMNKIWGNTFTNGCGSMADDAHTILEHVFYTDAKNPENAIETLALHGAKSTKEQYSWGEVWLHYTFADGSTIWANENGGALQFITPEGPREEAETQDG